MPGEKFVFDNMDKCIHELYEDILRENRIDKYEYTFKDFYNDVLDSFKTYGFGRGSKR